MVKQHVWRQLHMSGQARLEVGRRVAQEFVQGCVIGLQLVAAREDEDRVRRRCRAQRRQQRAQAAQAVAECILKRYVSAVGSSYVSQSNHRDVRASS